MKRGFSLVELSIVLVILGLLTGGILTGQTLIRASELRAVTTEFQRYQSAVNTFRDKYFALPGDMRNATDFWTEQASGIGCATASSTTMATCDGDGDGRIVSISTSHEGFRFWQQLTNAGLIEGTYWGVSGGTANDYITSNENSPASKFNSSYWFAWNWDLYDNVGINDFFFAHPSFSNILQIGRHVADSHTHGPAFKPEEVWNIDTKLDDGKPASGNVTTSPYNDCTNGTSVTDFNSDYALTSPDTACTTLFLNVF